MTTTFKIYLGVKLCIGIGLTVLGAGLLLAQYLFPSTLNYS